MSVSRGEWHVCLTHTEPAVGAIQKKRIACQWASSARTSGCGSAWICALLASSAVMSKTQSTLRTRVRLPSSEDPRMCEGTRFEDPTLTGHVDDVHLFQLITNGLMGTKTIDTCPLTASRCTAHADRNQPCGTMFVYTSHISLISDDMHADVTLRRVVSVHSGMIVL